MRAIDADALLGKFSFYDGVRIPEKDIDGFHNTMSYHDVKDEIRRAPTIGPPANWTPCSIGMPTSGDEVDVTLEATDNWEACTAIGIYRNGQWIVPGMEDRKVIAWHERLEPYEEK